MLGADLSIYFCYKYSSSFTVN